MKPKKQINTKEKDQNKTDLKENEIKTVFSNNLQSYTPLYSDDKRKTFRPTNANKKLNDPPFRQTMKKNEKERAKMPALKVQGNKNEKDKKSPKMKRLVNFTKKLMVLNPHQKSERLLKNKSGDSNDMKVNKSVGNLKDNLNDWQDSINNEDKNDNRESRTIRITDDNMDSNLKMNKTQEIKNDLKEEKGISLKGSQEDLLQNNLEITQTKKEEMKEEMQLKNDEKKDEINNEKDNTNNCQENENMASTAQITKKVAFTENKESKSSGKNLNKEQNNKSNKAYHNFVQGLQKSNTKKKNKFSNLVKPEDPRIKMANAVKKFGILSKSIKNINNATNANNDKPQPTVKNPLISALRGEIKNIMDDKDVPKAISTKNILNVNDIDDNNDINNDINESNKIKMNQNLEKFTGLILLKFNEGEKVLEIKLNGPIGNINAIFNKEKIEIDNKEVELIYKSDLERLRKENEAIESQYFKLRDEFDHQRELLENLEKEKKLKEEQFIFNALRKKTIENENKNNEEGRLKIKEIKDRIQKYKDELKKNNDSFDPMNGRMSYRINPDKKENLNIDQKMKELEKKKEKLMEENKKLKQIENTNEKPNNNIKTYKETKNEPKVTFQTEIKTDLSKNEKKKINQDQNQNANNLNTSVKDNKDKEKGYSKALDRFKKKYRKDASVQLRSKKSEKINEMAKNLEKAMDRQQSAEMVENRKHNNVSQVQNAQNASEIIENQPIINKTRKPKKPQI